MRRRLRVARAAPFRRARTLLEKARALAPDDARIHYLLGLLFSDHGQARDALAAFDASLLLNPDDYKAHNNRGSMLQILGRLSEADIAFRRALDLRPDLDCPISTWASCWRSRRTCRAPLRSMTSRSLAAWTGICSASTAPPAGAVDPPLPGSLGRRDVRQFCAHVRRAPREVAVQRAAAARGNAAAACRPSARDPRLGMRHGPGRCRDGGTGTPFRRRRSVGEDARPGKGPQRLRATRLAEIHALLRDAERSSIRRRVRRRRADLHWRNRNVVSRSRENPASGGWFVFSTEECAPDYQLLATGRYAQSEDYVRRLAAEAFAVLRADPTTIRIESGIPAARPPLPAAKTLTIFAKTLHASPSSHFGSSTNASVPICRPMPRRVGGTRPARMH